MRILSGKEAIKMAKKNEKSDMTGRTYTDVFRQNAMQFEELNKLRTKAGQTARENSKEIGDANHVDGKDFFPETKDEK